MTAKTWRIAGINFDHFHMGDLLRHVAEHPHAEIVGVCDEQRDRLAEAVRNFSLRDDQVFTDYRQCLESTRPDAVILCPAAARHAEWVERVAEYGVPVFMEKPFAATLAEADRMIAAMERAGKMLCINWPLCFVPAYVTAHRLVQEGVIGEVREVHSYGGNRGPLYHGADKVELEPTAERKAASWFYKRDEGGGSMLDYLGYGTTLATWYMNNAAPLDVTAVTGGTAGLEVDEHSITIARYAFGLSKFETRWGTLTDPWTHQPLPKCGFVLKGTEGSIAAYDYESTLRVQTRQRPGGYDVAVDPLLPPRANPIQYFLHCLDSGEPLTGPLSPQVSRIGQQIVDTAYQSALAGRTLPLLP
jgi:predicted dehydrogenase